MRKELYDPATQLAIQNYERQIAKYELMANEYAKQCDHAGQRMMLQAASAMRAQMSTYYAGDEAPEPPTLDEQLADYDKHLWPVMLPIGACVLAAVFTEFTWFKPMLLLCPIVALYMRHRYRNQIITEHCAKQITRK